MPAALSQSLNQNSSSKIKRRQLHCWISDEDYVFLRRIARNEDDSIARIVRRLIRRLRLSTDKELAA